MIDLRIELTIYEQNDFWNFSMKVKVNKNPKALRPHIVMTLTVI